MDERGISPFPRDAAAVDSLADANAVPRRDNRALLRDVWRTLTAVGPFGLASQVAYSLIFALPSIVLIVVVIAAAVGQLTGVSPLDALETAATRNLAPGAQASLRSLADNAMRRAAAPGPTISAIVSAVVALMVAGLGVRVLADACVRASDEADNRPLWRRQLVAVGAALALAALLVAAFAAILFGESLWGVATRAAFGAPVEGAGARAVRVVAEALVVFAVLLALYKTSFGRTWSWRLAAIGAVVATPLWFAASKGFQLYLRVSDPGSAYGAANSILILLAFLYVSSLIVIVGAMVTATLRRRQRIRHVVDDSPPSAR